MGEVIDRLRATANTILKKAIAGELSGRSAVRKTLASSALLASLSMVASTTWAQEKPNAENVEETVMPKIKVQDHADAGSATTSIGKLPQTLRDIPQVLTVIDRKTLDAQSATKLTDALRNVPGITISAGEGGQIGDNINLRGFSARTDLFLDGFRDRGQYSRDTFFLESVEVLKGPSSILFGRGSTGGVINQTSKKPFLRDASEIAASVGTEDYYRVTADVNEKLSDTSALRVVAMGHKNQSTRDLVDSKRYGLSPSVRFGVGTDTEILASALIQRNRDIPDYGFPLVQFQGQLAKPIDAPANQYYGFTDDRYDQDVNNFNLTIQHRVSDLAKLTNLSQYTLYKTVASPTPLGGLVDPVTGITPPATFAGLPLPGTPLSSLWAIRQQRDRLINDSSLYNQTNLTWVIPGVVTQTLLAGLDLGRDEYHNDTYSRMNSTFTASPLSNVSPLPAVNLGNPVYQAKPALSESLLRLVTSQTSATANSAGVYINDQLDLNSHWKLVLGLRWDRFEVQQNQYAYNYFPTNAGPITTPTITPTILQHTDSMPSERAGVIWQPNDQQSYYVAYGTSFDPSGEAITLSLNSSDLDPEKNKSYEIGGKLNLLNNALLMNAAIFRVEKVNARTTDPQVGTVQILDGLTRVDGFEVSVNGYISANWNVMAGYTFLDGKIVDSNDAATGANLGIVATGKVPQNVPRNNATFWSTYRFANVWEVSGGAVYASQRFVNNFDTAVIPGYVRGDLTAAFVQPRYDVRLNVLNVTDKVYFETASAGRATPATGRTFVVRLAYRF